MDKTVIKRIIEEDPFLKYVGVKVLSLKEGYCKISVGFRKELTRLGDMMNGGAIATLADSAGGCAVLTLNDRSNQVTVQLDTSFLRTIKTGPVVAEASVTRKGKVLSFADVKIFDGDKQLCAAAKGIWFVFGDIGR